jgi:hypothetical protein
MFKPRQGFAIFALAAVALLGLGCSSTNLTNIWTTPQRPSVQPEKVLVMALAKRPTIRRSFEDAFVAQLKSQKLDATASYSLQLNDATATPDAIAAQVKEKGFQAVILVTLVGVDKQLRMVEGSMAYPTMWGYYGYAYSTPGYITQDNIFMLELRCYETPSEKLIWSATSNVVNPDDVEVIAKGLATKMVQNMRRHELIK